MGHQPVPSFNEVPRVQVHVQIRDYHGSLRILPIDNQRTRDPNLEASCCAILPKDHITR